MSDFILMQRQSQETEERHPHPAATPLQTLADMVVHRVFGVGLVLQSAAGLAEGPVAERLTRAVDELDAIIQDVRSAALRQPGGPPPA